VLVERSGLRSHLPAAPVRVRDATGAGDTLAGEVLALLLSGESDLDCAVQRGMNAVRNLLLARGF